MSSTSGVIVASHTVTPAEAGLTIITAASQLFDNDGSTGGTTRVFCDLFVNGGGGGSAMSVHDNGGGPFGGDTTANTNIERMNLNAGDVVAVDCSAFSGADVNEADAGVDLLLARVNS